MPNGETREDVTGGESRGKRRGRLDDRLSSSDFGMYCTRGYD